MLLVTKLDGRKILISPATIKYAEETPDTLIQFINGDSLLIKESLADLQDIDSDYRRKILDTTAGESH